MWKCEKCGSLNKGEKCLVCGESFQVNQVKQVQQPIRPIQPIQPTQPIQPIQPTQPIQSTQPIQPIQPTQPIQSTQPIQPIQSTQPTQPIQPKQPLQSQPTHQTSSKVIKDLKSSAIVWILGILAFCYLGYWITGNLSSRHQAASSKKGTNTITSNNLISNNDTSTNTDTNVNNNTNTSTNTNTENNEQTTENNVSTVTNNADNADITKWDVSASSTLSSEGKLNYYPSNISDNKLSTSWVEGVSGSGIGEWAMLTTNINQKLKGIKIINGYGSNMEFYNKNNRVKLIQVELSDGTILEKQLEDTGIAWQYLDFGKEVVCNSIKITIKSVYKGSKYDDTCIAEIELY